MKYFLFKEFWVNISLNTLSWWHVFSGGWGYGSNILWWHIVRSQRDNKNSVLNPRKYFLDEDFWNIYDVWPYYPHSWIITTINYVWSSCRDQWSESGLAQVCCTMVTTAPTRDQCLESWHIPQTSHRLKSDWETMWEMWTSSSDTIFIPSQTIHLTQS